MFVPTAYIVIVEKEMVAFETEARQLTRIGDVQKAETMMNKCKLARKEVCTIVSMMSVSKEENARFQLGGCLYEDTS